MRIVTIFYSPVQSTPDITLTHLRRRMASLRSILLFALPLASALRVTPQAPKTRREWLQLAGAASAALPFAGRVEAAAKPDYAGMSEALKDMVAEDPNLIGTFIRLAWHSSGTYDAMTKTGGSGGGTMRFKEELSHGANAGLSKMVDKLEPLHAQFPGVSYADTYTLAGKVAIEAAKGPTVPWKAGRVDALTPDAVTADGRLPAADKGSPDKTIRHLRMDVFYRMGFNDQEIVALSGAHALGRCHPDASGYSGPWTPTPTLMTTGYYNLLISVPWTLKEWNGPMQFEDPSGKLMMLPSDIALIQDKKFREYVKMYAKDKDLFFKDFAAAFVKLEELGTKNLKSVGV